MKTIALIVMIWLAAPLVRAETISVGSDGPTGPRELWNWTHFGFGDGSANVFDGGPVVFDSSETFGPTDSTVDFFATDDTRPGSLGAFDTASGISEIQPTLIDIRITAKNSVLYWGSIFAGGDRPGGMAEAELHSVIEIEMPTDELEWLYRLTISQGFGWAGSTSVLVENVTQSQIVLDLSDPVSTMLTTLYGNVGDVIRITSDMNGQGTVPPGSTGIGSYSPNLRMIFTVPEPTTDANLLLAAAILLPRRRLNCRSHSETPTDSRFAHPRESRQSYAYPFPSSDAAGTRMRTPWRMRSASGNTSLFNS